MRSSIFALVFLLLGSSLLRANVAPEFRHPCSGTCCVSGAQPGTYSNCKMVTKDCRSQCLVQCEGGTIICGTHFFSFTACQSVGRYNAVDSCNDLDPTNCDAASIGNSDPCSSIDCIEKRDAYGSLCY